MVWRICSKKVQKSAVDVAKMRRRRGRFIQYLNNVKPFKKFTMVNEGNGIIPFMHIKIEQIAMDL